MLFDEPNVMKQKIFERIDEIKSKSKDITMHKMLNEVIDICEKAYIAYTQTNDKKSFLEVAEKVLKDIKTLESIVNNNNDISKSNGTDSTFSLKCQAHVIKVGDFGINTNGLPNNFIEWIEDYINNRPECSEIQVQSVLVDSVKEKPYFFINDVLKDYIPTNNILCNKGELERVFITYREVIAQEIWRRLYWMNSLYKKDNPASNDSISCFGIRRPDGSIRCFSVSIPNSTKMKEISSKKGFSAYELFNTTTGINLTTFLYMIDPKLSKDSMLLKWLANTIIPSISMSDVVTNNYWPYKNRPIHYNWLNANSSYKTPPKGFNEFKEKYFLTRPNLSNVPSAVFKIFKDRRGYSINDVYDYFKDLEVPEKQYRWYLSIFWGEIFRRMMCYPLKGFDKNGLVCFQKSNGSFYAYEFDINNTSFNKLQMSNNLHSVFHGLGIQKDKGKFIYDCFQHYVYHNDARGKIDRYYLPTWTPLNGTESEESYKPQTISNDVDRETWGEALINGAIDGAVFAQALTDPNADFIDGFITGDIMFNLDNKRWK